MIRLKMFDIYEFLLCNVRCILELKQNLLSICMFHDLGYKVEHVLLKILNSVFIIAKGYKICGLYIIYCLTVLSHALLDSKYFCNMWVIYYIWFNKLWSLRLRYDSDKRNDNGLEFVIEKVLHETMNKKA